MSEVLATVDPEMPQGYEALSGVEIQKQENDEIKFWGILELGHENDKIVRKVLLPELDNVFHNTELEPKERDVPEAMRQLVEKMVTEQTAEINQRLETLEQENKAWQSRYKDLEEQNNELRRQLEAALASNTATITTSEPLPEPVPSPVLEPEPVINEQPVDTEERLSEEFGSRWVPHRNDVVAIRDEDGFASGEWDVISNPTLDQDGNWVVDVTNGRETKQVRFDDVVRTREGVVIDGSVPPADEDQVANRNTYRYEDRPTRGLFARWRGRRQVMIDEPSGREIAMVNGGNTAAAVIGGLVLGGLIFGIVDWALEKPSGVSRTTITRVDKKVSTSLRKQDTIIKNQQEELRREKTIENKQATIVSNQADIKSNQERTLRHVHIYGNHILHHEKQILAAEKAEAKAEAVSLSGGPLTESGTGRVFKVEFGHGIIQELQEYSKANGYGYLRITKAMQIYQGMRARFGTGLVKSLGNGDDTYVRSAGDVGISRPGPAYWPPHVRDYIISQLSSGH